MPMPPGNRKPTPPFLVAIAALAVLAAVPAGAQPAPCGFANPVTQCFDQETVGVVSVADLDEMLGAALAFGDFDGDGFDDLAVGVPGESRDVAGGGLVHVFYGSAGGLTLTGSDQFDQGALPGETVEAGDAFGFALAAGDFNGDPFDDLAIGAPFESHPGCPFGCTSSGVFHVVYGSAGGLDLAGAETFTNDLGIPGATAADGNEFGSMLAAGQVSTDGLADLLVCAPGFRLGPGSPDRAGRCFVIFGAFAGLNQGVPPQVRATGGSTGQRLGSAGTVVDFAGNGAGSTVYGDPRHDDTPLVDSGAARFNGLVVQEEHVGSAGLNGSGTRFGQALATGDLDHDGIEDLVIGGPGRTFSTPAGPIPDAGIVYLLLGEPGGLDLESIEALVLHQALLFGSGDLEAGDLHGSALATGDFDGDGIDDLAIGAPGEGPSGIGRVIIVFGGEGGPDLDRTADFIQSDLGGSNFPVDSLGQVMAAGDVDGDGRDELAIGVPLKNVNGRADAGMVYVHSFPAAPLPPDIFADGFESGDVSAWSAAVPLAAAAGTGR